MIVKPLCDYDITTLHYIEDTLVMLNEVYGATHLSRDRDDILSLHKECPQKSPHGYGYSRAAAVYKHVRLSGFLCGVESGLGFRFPIEWDNNHVETGVLNIKNFINEIRKAIEEKKSSNNFVYMRLKELKDKRLRVMYSLVSEYDKMDYKYITRYKKDSYIVSVWSKFPYKRGDYWTSDTFSLDIEDISGLLPRTDWPVEWEDDRPVLVSEILQAIIKLDEERNGTILGNDIRQQAVDKTFTLETDIQAAIDKYRRELEVTNNG